MVLAMALEFPDMNVWKSPDDGFSFTENEVASWHFKAVWNDPVHEIAQNSGLGQFCLEPTDFQFLITQFVFVDNSSCSILGFSTQEPILKNAIRSLGKPGNDRVVDLPVFKLEMCRSCDFSDRFWLTCSCDQIVQDILSGLIVN